VLWSPARAADDFADVRREIAARHDEAVKRLQHWIALPSIAAEGLNSAEGADYMARLAREAGFGKVAVIPTDGKPGVFATFDAGAKNTVGLYFMYDVKQYDAAEWTSPPLEARLVDKPGFGKVVMGRGAVNQKGPEAALRRCVGVFMPAASQDPDGVVTVSLGAKGVVELELVSSGEKWGRGPGKDIHSSLKAMVDSPAWRLVKALDTLVSKDGNTITIDGYPKPRPLSAEERAMIAQASRRRREEKSKELLTVKHWIDDLPWLEANERLESQPTVNIEGLVGGYTGPGGKTILPHRAAAKIDLRLVPDMKKDDAVAALKAHLGKHGFGDIEVNVTGGYDPTATAASARLIQAQLAVLKRAGIDPVLWPRNAGSYPGYVFTGEPLKLASGHFGLGHGSGAHAPDEYYVIESTNPNVQGFDGAVMSFVQYLDELAK
jgi:acetylornithine deacetylase/succinyl-diaminopimelate desuccinylase-like protein